MVDSICEGIYIPEGIYLGYHYNDGTGTSGSVGTSQRTELVIMIHVCTLSCVLTGTGTGSL